LIHFYKRSEKAVMASPALTCITCQIKFSDGDLHRLHFKGDWHRYNLKRKVAELPTITLQEFQERKDAHEAAAAGQQAASVRENYCVACSKNFKSCKAYENHVESKKHQEMILKFEAKPIKKPPPVCESEDDMDEDDSDLEMEEVDSDEWEEDWEGEPIPVTDCLFCSHHSRDMETNLKHMSVQHSFFIPDPEFCTDVEGLLTYLGAKVGQGLMCLWCNERGKSFSSLVAVQRHMVDSGHCKLLHEGEALIEYDEWYDYSTSYPANQDQETMDADQEVDLDVIDDSGYQLALPSGIKIGHRSLLRYYRQSLNPERAVVPKDRSASGKLLSTYRALGWTGSSGKDAQVKARDLGYMRRLQNYHSMKLGSKANKLRGNTHFRDRNGMC